MKIVSIVGARPQFIKAAVVSRQFARHGIDETLVHTGQHYDHDMSQIFFEQLGLPSPAYNLGVGSGLHGQQTGRMLEGIERLLLSDRPDWAVVYGDTNSTAAGAIAAAKLGIPLAHVEAGLRSFRRTMPEEINRKIADHLSDVLFAVSDASASNLLREGMDPARIETVGDVMLDAVKLFAGNMSNPVDAPPTQYALATFHRAENVDDHQRLRRIWEALENVSKTIPVVIPLHPRARAALTAAGLLNAVPPTMRLLPPLGYLQMLQLCSGADCVLTDSGGLQKEAVFLGKRVIVLRDETEWIELVQHGVASLWPPMTGTNLTEVVRALRLRGDVDARILDLFGSGKASERIALRLAKGAQ